LRPSEAKVIIKSSQPWKIISAHITSNKQRFSQQKISYPKTYCPTFAAYLFVVDLLLLSVIFSVYIRLTGLSVFVE
jgi:hypothetical protein